MERLKKGIALVVNDRKRLVGVVTNADIRRAVLKKVSLDDKVTKVMNRNPTTATHRLSSGEFYRLMVEKNIDQLPIINDQGEPIGIIYESTLRQERVLLCPVVIMAGGLGERLRPFTEKVPKPLLNVGGKSMIQIVIERFREQGVKQFFISVNYKAEMIEEYLGDGSNFRVEIKYLKEKKRLGTAGSLSLLPKEISSPFFVVNADVITDLDFRAIYQSHRDNQSDLTVAVKKVSYQVPYGTIEVEYGRIVSLSEKPHINKYVNAGIYILEAWVVGEIPVNQFFDMTDLINKLIAGGRVVDSYLINGTWVDVGQKKDYEQVNANIGSKRRDQGMGQETVFELNPLSKLVEAP
jgi:dTDP-glucose pyrophosphorylase